MNTKLTLLLVSHYRFTFEIIQTVLFHCIVFFTTLIYKQLKKLNGQREG